MSNNQSAEYGVETTDLYIVSVLYSAISFASIVGNLLVLTAFFKSSKLRRTHTNYLIVSLSITDLVAGSIAIPLYTHLMIHNFQGYNESVEYFTFQFADVFSITGSVWHLAFISLERYFAIVWPVMHHVATAKIYYAGIALVWVISLVSGLTAVIFFDYGLTYIAYFSATSFGLPLVFILFSYISILRTTLRRTFVASRRVFDRELKVALTIFILIALFVTCWCPFFVIAVYSAICYCISIEVAVYFKALHFATTFVNPVVYAFRVPDFADAFRKTFPKKLISLMFCLQRDRESPPNSRVRAPSTLSSTAVIVDTAKEKQRHPSFADNNAAVEQLVVSESTVAGSVTSSKSVTFLSDNPSSLASTQLTRV